MTGAKTPVIIVFFCAVPNDTFKNAQLHKKVNICLI